MNFKTSVGCPDCGTPIEIESTLLLSGCKFNCANPTCNVAISLTDNDKGRVMRAFEQFAKVRSEAVEQAERAN